MPHPATTDPQWRLRSLHRAMSPEEFRRTIPILPGWKREYYGGKVHFRPNWVMVLFEKYLAPIEPIRAPGLRSIQESDWELLHSLFLDSFRAAPEYADDADELYPHNASRYLEGFFSGTRGSRSASSRILIRNGEAVAAAAIKHAPRWPILDCLMVRPRCFRQGFATLVARAGLAALVEEGYTRVRSAAKLANSESIAWHLAFGFAEVPSLMVTEDRWSSALNERERLQELGLLTPELDARFMTEIAQYEIELDALEKLRQLDLEAVYPTLE